MNEEYTRYIKNLKDNGEPIELFDCPCCGQVIETLANLTSSAWDTMSFCPHCDDAYIKITLPNGGGVIAKSMAELAEERERAPKVREPLKLAIAPSETAKLLAVGLQRLGVASIRDLDVASIGYSLPTAPQPEPFECFKGHTFTPPHQRRHGKKKKAGRRK